MLLFYSPLGRFRPHPSSMGEKGFGRKRPNGLPILPTPNDEEPHISAWLIFLNFKKNFNCEKIIVSKDYK